MLRNKPSKRGEMPELTLSSVYPQETTLVLAIGYGGRVGKEEGGRHIATPIFNLKETGTKGKTKAVLIGNMTFKAKPIFSLKETGTKGKTKAVLIGNMTFKGRDTRTDIV
ncbi:hypothetical protein QE152_g32260 [Popillia japonica]|uniref:Uncharacterized protein n=1 Tax=Popillia japonica TaxID=7064 RepID=A0AAW1IZW5_POPJA